MIVFDCAFEPPHTHEYPDDWVFGGADNTHPGADPRYRASTYIYLDGHLDEMHVTQAPLCDDEAIDEFTKFAGLGVKYLQVQRPGSRDKELLPWQYDVATDLVSPL